MSTYLSELHDHDGDEGGVEIHVDTQADPVRVGSKQKMKEAQRSMARQVEDLAKEMYARNPIGGDGLSLDAAYVAAGSIVQAQSIGLAIRRLQFALTEAGDE